MPLGATHALGCPSPAAAIRAPPPFLSPPIDGDAGIPPSIITSSHFFSPPSILTSPPTFLCREPRHPTATTYPHRHQARLRRRPLPVSSVPPFAAKWDCCTTLSLVVPSAGCLFTGSDGAAGSPPRPAHRGEQSSCRAKPLGEESSPSGRL
jgi:hypothetical protein